MLKKTFVLSCCVVFTLALTSCIFIGYSTTTCEASSASLFAVKEELPPQIQQRIQHDFNSIPPYTTFKFRPSRSRIPRNFLYEWDHNPNKNCSSQIEKRPTNFNVTLVADSLYFYPASVEQAQKFPLIITGSFANTPKTAVNGDLSIGQYAVNTIALGFVWCSERRLPVQVFVCTQNGKLINTVHASPRLSNVAYNIVGPLPIPWYTAYYMEDRQLFNPPPTEGISSALDLFYQPYSAGCYDTYLDSYFNK